MNGEVVQLFPRDDDRRERPRRRQSMAPAFFQDPVSHRFCDHDVDCPPDLLCDRGRCV